MRNKTKQMTPLRWMLKRYFFLAVAFVLVFFALFPLQGMMRILNTLEFMEDIRASQDPSWYIEELTRDFVYSPLNLEMICLLVGLTGFAAAMVLFRHGFSRRQSMMYAALPVTRSRGFILRLEAYGILCGIPMALCLLLYPMMIRLNGLDFLFDRGDYFHRAAFTILINGYGFSIGALCASLFGTLWSATLGGLLLTCSAEAALMCWWRIADAYLNTMYTVGLSPRLLSFSPTYSLYKNFYERGSASMWPGILAIPFLLGLAVLAYRRVKTENAGHTLSLKKLEPFLLAWVSFLGGTAGALVFSFYMGVEAMLYLGAVVGCFAAALLTGMLLEQRVYFGLRAWKIPTAAACLILLAFTGLHGDWLGYNRWRPERESLTSVQICPNQNLREPIRCETGEEINAALRWVDQAREEHLEARAKKVFNQVSVLDVLVCFEDQNGHTVNREYSFLRDWEAEIPALQTLAKAQAKGQSESIQKLSRVYAYGALNTFGMDQQVFYQEFGFYPNDRFSHLDPARLREALAKDLQARTLETLQQPILITLSFESANPKEYVDDLYYSQSYEIRPDDRNTLREILGEDMDKWIDYAQGGFARSTEVLVFRCDYTEQEGNGGWKLDSYHRAESEEEVREWMKEASQAYDPFFAYNEDTAHRVVIYSLDTLRQAAEYGEVEWDPEDPEVQKKLPELEGVWGISYNMKRGQKHESQ